MPSTFLGTIIPGALSVSITSSSGWSSMFPPRAKWSTEQIPDLSGLVMIVTGGNAGIGRETVKVRMAQQPCASSSIVDAQPAS